MPRISDFDLVMVRIEFHSFGSMFAICSSTAGMPELPPALDRAYNFPPACSYHMSDISFAVFVVHHTLHGNGACKGV